MHKSDFDEFTAWYTARQQRRFGAPPAPATIKGKKGYLAVAGKEMGCTTEQELGELVGDRTRLTGLFDMLSARVSPAAVVQVYHALKLFGEYAVVRGWIDSYDIRPDDRPSRVPSKPIEVYTPVEMETFVSSARGVNLRWWAFMAFLTETGRRIGEALSLEWAWYTPGDPPYFALPHTKNGDQQLVPLTSFLREQVFIPENIAAMKQMPTRRRRRCHLTYVFPWEYNSVHKMFAKFCERTGLPNRGFHNFRHTVITNRLAAGVPLQAVTALAGHRTPQVTMRRYAHATALDYARFLN